MDARGQVTGSYTTTYHLRFVRVPHTWIVEKQAGEASQLTLARQGGQAVIVDVR